MNDSSLANTLARFFEIRPGEGRRVALMVSLLFLLLAANNVIKVERDSLFLSRFPIGDLSYVYLLVALLAGLIIDVYTRYTIGLPFYQLILGTYALIISNVCVFWYLIVFLNFAWAIYVFYIWSAIVGVLAITQLWTLADLTFTPREARRLFGIFGAGGSLGAILGGFASKWIVNLFARTDELFWFIGALFVGAFAVVWAARNELREIKSGGEKEIATKNETNADQPTGAIGAIRTSRYLQLIAGTIFLSVIVSTLIDFQFKGAAKATYASQEDLTNFFGSYYAWVALITFVGQVFLTRRLLTGFGLTASLLILPMSLFAGSFSILLWPGLFSTTATDLSDSVLRTSVNQSGMQLLYLPLSVNLKKRVTTFLDVVLQRLGDGAAGLIVLIYVLFFMQFDVAGLAYVSLVLMVFWATLIFLLRRGYVEALRAGLEAQAITWKDEEINYADKQTIEAILRTLQGNDEHALLFGLELAEKLDPEIVAARLPLRLLQHPSPLVRSRSLKFFSATTEPAKLKEIVRFLEDGNGAVQAEAINVVCAIRKEDAIPIMRPYLENPDPRVQRSAIECLLQHGDAAIHEVALASFHKMIIDASADGAAARIEAARLIGDVNEPEFSMYLSKLIREDSSIPVIREALAAAGKKKEPTVLRDVITRLGCPKTKDRAHLALIEYGDFAVKTLQEVLLDSNSARDVRLNIPVTLGEIESPDAMGALLSGLSQEDGSVRYRVIVGLADMARRSPNLRADRNAVEAAIVSEVSRYYRRFLIFFALFGDDDHGSMSSDSLLRQALLENMKREKERVLRLLSLIYSPKDVGSATAALLSADRAKQAQAIEFLDNVLTGDIKDHVFPLFDDVLNAERFQKFLTFFGLKSLDGETALQELLKQDDLWLSAAALWEIGLRGLQTFRRQLEQYLDSTEPVLKETAALVISRI